jgi:hypothetical protein
VTDKEKALMLEIFDEWIATVEYASYLHAMLFSLDPEWPQELLTLKKIAQEKGLGVQNTLALDLQLFRECIERSKIKEARVWFKIFQELFSETPPPSHG